MTQAKVSLVCGHVKVFINDECLAKEFLALLPLPPASSPAAAVSETAIAAQNLIAGKLQKHCPSLRDAMFLTKHVLSPDTANKLVHINAAHSAHRHDTSVSAADLLAKLESELDGYINLPVSEQTNARVELSDKAKDAVHKGKEFPNLGKAAAHTGNASDGLLDALRVDVYAKLDKAEATVRDLGADDDSFDVDAYTKHIETIELQLKLIDKLAKLRSEI